MSLSIALPGKTTTPTTSTSTTTTQNKSADLTLIRGVVSDVLANKANDTTYSADAAAQRETAAGYDAEIDSYTSSGLTAEQNAAYTKVAGDILGVQNTRKTERAIGQETAGLAGSGFSATSGSAIDQVRDSLQEGYLADQLVRMQSLYDQAGYLEEASASKSETTAATNAKSYALSTASTYDTAADQAKTYAANETTSLSNYLSKFNLKTTADDLLSGKDIGDEIATAPKVSTTDTTGSSTTGETTFTADKSKLGSLSGYYKGPTYNSTTTNTPSTGLTTTALTGGLSIPSTTAKKNVGELL